MTDLEVVEICAGAGGQSLGLHLAGFKHRLAVELDTNACNTLRENLSTREKIDDPEKVVVQGDVADPEKWKPSDHVEVDLFAGGVPCPPFSIAGKQLGATDERDLFAWAVEQVEVMRPRALMLENVRGLSMPRFAAYRQHVLDKLTSQGYVGEWKLLHASDFGVPQLRPRFVLIALQEEDAPYFHWPDPLPGPPPTVGKTLHALMASKGWTGADAWARRADKIAPTIVGGSKKHGGADLGPTRAKQAWREMGVDAMGVADDIPNESHPADYLPKLTTAMVARLQGWDDDEYQWTFTGRKTSVYRQIGNAFPPPVARAIGEAIVRAFNHEGEPTERLVPEIDPIYRALRDSDGYLTPAQLARKSRRHLAPEDLERHISRLSRDFTILTSSTKSGVAYKLVEFKAFTGQENHSRHEAFQMALPTIS
ncbi:DNA (cytosine-5)-methyltransferase 1 [Streptosporangium subroseum]|uniref:Cytosine-specific methyltransferase n=1 Tax=Streptosporangium subroseum TaxID=106412 RepID=A0A239EU83_9ACTN|nr:DNA (cytosine-5-)-methyltransferase [Streptosporangium subroseum]SNS47981.1 DNA (cytosine-5)-methyltransferase 1 [Streptosporangium subroseum]